MLIHVPKIFNCKVSFKCHFNVLVIAENFEQLMSSNFQNCNFKIITITVTEIGFIQVFFFYRCSKQKIKIWNTIKTEYLGTLIPVKSQLYSEPGSSIFLLFGSWSLVLYLLVWVKSKFFRLF